MRMSQLKIHNYSDSQSVRCLQVAIIMDSAYQSTFDSPCRMPTSGLLDSAYAPNFAVIA